MTPTNIGFWISTIFWLINWIMEKVMHNDEAASRFYLTMEFVCLGFMWIFIGFNHGWW